MFGYEMIIAVAVAVILGIVVWLVMRRRKNILFSIHGKDAKSLDGLKQEFDETYYGIIDTLQGMNDPYEAYKIVLGEYKATKEAIAQTAALLETVQRQYEQLKNEHQKNIDVMSKASHQMRTSLSGLIGFASFLEQSPLNDEQKEYFDYINESTKELLNLINAVPNIDQMVVKGRNGVQPAKAVKNAIPRILVVDDNRINQKLIGKVLDSMNKVEVSFALNGKEALGLRMENDYDLIFMDVQMPVMDGVEATKKIREWETEHTLAPVTIVALTANTASSEREKYVEAGMDGYASKPINIDEIKQIVNTII